MADWQTEWRRRKVGTKEVDELTAGGAIILPSPAYIMRMSLYRLGVGCVVVGVAVAGSLKFGRSLVVAATLGAESIQLNPIDSAAVAVAMMAAHKVGGF